MSKNIFIILLLVGILIDYAFAHRTTIINDTGPKIQPIDLTGMDGYTIFVFLEFIITVLVLNIILLYYGKTSHTKDPEEYFTYTIPSSVVEYTNTHKINTRLTLVIYPNIKINDNLFKMRCNDIISGIQKISSHCALINLDLGIKCHINISLNRKIKCKIFKTNTIKIYYCENMEEANFVFDILLGLLLCNNAINEIPSSIKCNYNMNIHANCVLPNSMKIDLNKLNGISISDRSLILKKYGIEILSIYDNSAHSNSIICGRVIGYITKKGKLCFESYFSFQELIYYHQKVLEFINDYYNVIGIREMTIEDIQKEIYRYINE